jgi:hypothetical protein
MGREKRLTGKRLTWMHQSLGEEVILSSEMPSISSEKMKRNQREAST